MDVQVAETGPCSRTLTIKVSPEEVREHVDRMYASAANQVQLKGFRKGKVPRKVLEKKYGSGILQEAKDHLIDACFRDAIKQHDLSIVGKIHVDDYEKVELVPDQPLEFTVQLDVRPEFELKSVKGIEVQTMDPTPTDEDVENALKEIANQKRSLKTVDEPVAEGDFVKVDMTFADGEGNTVHERKGVQLNTQIPVAGTDPQVFSQTLVGRTPGEQVNLEIQFPDSFEKEAVRGQKGNVTLLLHEVLRVVPAPVDDALAKDMDFDTLDALREDLRKRIGDEKERLEKNRREDQLLQVLLNDHPFELPASMVEDQTNYLLKNFEERMRQGEVPEDQIRKKLDESREEARQDAERRVRLYFLIDAIAKKEKIFVTESDLDTELRKIAEQNNVPVAAVREFLTNNNQIGELRLGILERKVRDFLTENAVFSDNKGA